MTNLTKISRMTAKQMADWRSMISKCICCLIPQNDSCYENEQIACWHCIYRWLKSASPVPGLDNHQYLTSRTSQELAKIFGVSGIVLIENYSPIDGIEPEQALQEWLEKEVDE